MSNHDSSLNSKNSNFLDDLHKEIETYFNGALFSRSDSIFSLLYPRFPFMTHASGIVRTYNDSLRSQVDENNKIEKVHIKPYKGKNIYVQKMIDYLEKHLENDLIGAYVHGSLGTDE